MSSRSRPAAVRAAARARLAAEPLLPVAELAGLALDLGGDRQHPTARVLVRWIEHGRKCGAARVYLDGYECDLRVTWVTSREAVARFVAAVNGSGQAPAVGG